jgi:hypothetical protein
MVSLCVLGACSSSAKVADSPTSVVEVTVEVPAATTSPPTAAATTPPPNTTVAPTTTGAAVTTTRPTVALTTTTTTSTTLPATTTTIDPAEAAKGAYFLLTAQINQIQDFVYKGRNSIPWRELPAICAAMGPAEEDFANGVAAYPWPAAAKDDADAVAKADAVLAGLFYQCAKQPGTASGQSDINRQITDASNVGTAASSAMRQVLGLPINR